VTRAPVLSVVVPVYRSAEVLPETHARLSSVLSDFGPEMDYEIVFVNDGSPDDSLTVLRGLAAADQRVRVVNLSRNFGHQIALTAGLDNATGDAVVVIDDDLQDPPEVIAEMVGLWRDGNDVVNAVRTERQGESVFKKWTASIFYRVLARLSDTPLPLDSGDFRLMDRRVVDALTSMREESRYVRGMVAWTGFKQVALPYTRHPRHAGDSGYTFGRMLKLAMDGILSFSTKPLELTYQFGMAVTLTSFLAGVYLIVERIIEPQSSVPGWTTVVVAVLFMGGVQLLSIGVLGAYLGRIFYEAKRRPLYIVAERLNFRESDNDRSDG